ncbi:hypothetical protein [Ammoniphilus sp. 3BR4]|uniref:hypothetical protein n=1 Tax=Ammoniphilus sp. 3BR4 TaxID=3158265 RepID=UPI003465EB37
MIFLEPQFRNEHGEILNVVNAKGKAVGYLSYMYKDQGDLYVLGQLEDEGEKQNFLDVTTHFIDGLKQSVIGNEETDPYVYIHLGGEVLKVEKSEEKDAEKTEEE